MKRSVFYRPAVLGFVLFMLSGALLRGAEPASPRPGVAAIKVPPGFVVQQVAGPPLVERPMLASFDDRGRLYVCDSAGVNLRGAELAKNPPHAIRMLEDTDGDGRFDKTTLFADKMVFPQGIVWHDGAVYCSSPPSFWRLADTDGDGAADQREQIVTGFANTGVADDMHGGSLGPDGRLYLCAGRFPHEIHRPGGPVIHKGTAPLIIRCRPDGSELEVVCGSQGNAVGVAFTPEGDMFASGTFLAPNSMGAGLRDALVHCVDGAEYPVRDRTLNEHRRTGDLLPPLSHLGVAAASDLAIARGDALGAGYRGNLFSALFNMHKIMRHRLEPAGATWQCRNEDFLVSSDTDFHPTDVLEDADGSLLVIDTGGWFRIGCPTSQIAKPDVMGAIYRVRREDSRKVDDPRGLAIDWQGSLAPTRPRSCWPTLAPRSAITPWPNWLAAARPRYRQSASCCPATRTKRPNARPCGRWRASMPPKPAPPSARRSRIAPRAFARPRPAPPACTATVMRPSGWPCSSRPTPRRFAAKPPRRWAASATRPACPPCSKRWPRPAIASTSTPSSSPSSASTIARPLSAGWRWPAPRSNAER